MVVRVKDDDIVRVIEERQREPLRLRADATYFVSGGHDFKLQDTMLETMTHADFVAATRSKYNVTPNLHNHLPRDLDFFLCLSSATGQIGSIAQGNHNAGNRYQDSLCAHRGALGLAGANINLGWMGDIGFVAESDRVRVPQVVRDVVRDLRASRFFATMDAVWNNDAVSGGQLVLDLAMGGPITHIGRDEPCWFRDARFSAVRAYDAHQSKGEDAAKATNKVDIKLALASAKIQEEAKVVVLSGLMAKLAWGLMMELEDMDASRPINMYDVDSLVSEDIKAWAMKELHIIVHVSNVLNCMPLADLAGKMAEASSCWSSDIDALVRYPYTHSYSLSPVVLALI